MLASIAVIAAACLIEGFLIGSWPAVLVTLIAGATLIVVLFLSARKRYLDIATLSNQVDEILHGARDLSFDSMKEGELAVLASEIDKMSSRLILAAEELEREKSLLADSLANISHQIRTPLTSLGLQLELALRNKQDPERQLQYLREMRSIIEHIQWLVSALLKFARLDSGVITMEMSRITLSELIRDSVRRFELSYELKGVQLKLSLDEKVSFMGDRAWMAEALQNILKNCLEHTPKGGLVEISTTEDSLATRISICDNGPGISKEDLPHIFERFYRGANSSISEVNPQGLGIGLALAKELIAAQGGVIKAHNRRDGGACFEIIFPKAVL